MDVNANVQQDDTILAISGNLKQTKSPQIDSINAPKQSNRLRRCIWLATLITAISMPIFCISIYVTALLHGHVEPILPYISDAGTLHPQAAFFAQMIDLMAIILTMSAFVRYKQLKYCIRHQMVERMSVSKEYDDLAVRQQLIDRLNRMNLAACIIAYIGMFMMVITANYRLTEWAYPHMVSSIISFFAIYIYSILMVKISFRLSKFEIESRPITLTVFTTIGTVCAITSGVTSAISLIIGSDIADNDELRLHWNAQQPGYWWHVWGTANEWLLVNIFGLILLCFCRRAAKFDEWHRVSFFR